MSKPWSSLILFAILSIHSAFGSSVLSLPKSIVHKDKVRSLESRQASGVTSTQNFVRRGWHASAVAKNFLYIDGGEYSYKTSDEAITYQYSSATLSIDLSNDWRNDSVVLHTTNKPAVAPKLSSPVFAYDEKNDIFYSGFSGRVSTFGDSPAPPPLSLWSFKPDGTGSGTWKREISSDDSEFNGISRSFKAYIAYGGDAALVLGGVANFATDDNYKDVGNDIALPGLLTLNMTTKAFTNSTAKINRESGAVLGRMHYVPSFGPNGLFMAMGGSYIPEHSTDNLVNFGKIWVYEAETDTWFNQTATGNIPLPRKEFCLSGANSTNGTYEIFLYGGQNGNLGAEAVPYDEIFILTLPAFRWLKVDYQPQNPRHGHTCEYVGGSQILSIGGVDSNALVHVGNYGDIDKSSFNSSVDPFAQGLGIFDMTTLKWADHYSANPPAYEQSELVRNYYTQNPQDGSQFSTSGLRDLFKVTHFSQDTPTSGNSNIPPAPHSSSSTSSSSSDHTGAIAGGVIGGVAGIALAATAAFYLFRRRKRGRYAKPTGSSTPEELQGNNAQQLDESQAHQLQEIDGNQVEGYYKRVDKSDGGEGGGYHDLPPQHLVEMEEPRPEMGEGIPAEMEASPVGRGR